MLLVISKMATDRNGDRNQPLTWSSDICSEKQSDNDKNRLMDKTVYADCADGRVGVSVKRHNQRKQTYLLLPQSAKCVAISKKQIVVKSTQNENFLISWRKEALVGREERYLICFVAEVGGKYHIIHFPRKECSPETVAPKLSLLPANWNWDAEDIQDDHHAYWFLYSEVDDCVVFRSLFNGDYLLKVTDDGKSVEFRYHQDFKHDITFYKRLSESYLFRLIHRNVKHELTDTSTFESSEDDAACCASCVLL